jgi:hypothetical protein|tara:strand:+ start:12522 stop:12707 length:186 start_codon:yes stop_codon:yes gene_type:complete
MECTQLNIVLVASFAFVSVALGVKWISQTLIEYALAQQGLQMSKLTQEDIDRMFQEDEDED